jgi:hypothetical protein
MFILGGTNNGTITVGLFIAFGKCLIIKDNIVLDTTDLTGISIPTTPLEIMALNCNVALILFYDTSPLRYSD